jgi:membrane-bound ClpP family serine protease
VIIVSGELWDAKSASPVKIGEEVIVIGMEKLLIEVKKRRVTKC